MAILHSVNRSRTRYATCCSSFLSLVQCCDVRIQCEIRWGEQPLPIKNKSSLNVSFSLVCVFQKIKVAEMVMVKVECRVVVIHSRK